MRRKEREIHELEEIEAIIQNAKICRVSFSVDNMPYIVPMNHGYQDRTLYFHCAAEGKKLDMIEKNSQVCFEIEGRNELVTGEKACDWTMNYESVIGFGTASIITDNEAKSKGLNILMNHYQGPTEERYNDKMLDRIKIIKIEIKEMTGKRWGF